MNLFHVSGNISQHNQVTDGPLKSSINLSPKMAVICFFSITGIPC